MFNLFVLFKRQYLLCWMIFTVCFIMLLMYKTMYHFIEERTVSVFFAYLFPVIGITAFSKTVSLEIEEGFFEIYKSLPHNKAVSLISRFTANAVMLLILIGLSVVMTNTFIVKTDMLFMMLAVIKPTFVLTSLALFFTCLTGNRFIGMLFPFLLWAEELVFKAYLTKGLSLYADYMVKYRKDLYSYSIVINSVILYSAAAVLVAASVILYKRQKFTNAIS
jgi:hypothetical protein